MTMQISGNVSEGVMFARPLYSGTQEQKQVAVKESNDVESKMSKPLLSKSSAACLSILLTIPGNLSVMIGAVNLVVGGVDAEYSKWSYGIWCGVFSVVAGTLLKTAADSDLLIMVKACTWASGFGLIFTLIQMALSCQLIAMASICDASDSQDNSCKELTVILIFPVMLLLTGIIQLIFGFWIFVICCKVVCCCKKSKTAIEPMFPDNVGANCDSHVVVINGYTQQPSEQPLSQSTVALVQSALETAEAAASAENNQVKKPNDLQGARPFFKALRDGFEKV